MSKENDKTKSDKLKLHLIENEDILSILRMNIDDRSKMPLKREIGEHNWGLDKLVEFSSEIPK